MFTMQLFIAGGIPQGFISWKIGLVFGTFVSENGEAS
jgi:hypothetical protein